MPRYRRVTLGFLVTLALLGVAGTAAAQSPDPAGPPKPDPAPAAAKQSTVPPAPSSSGSSSSRSPSPSPAPTYTPAPVVSPAPSSSSTPAQSTSTPSAQVTRSAKAKAASARVAKARAARAKAAKAKAARARARAAKAKAAKPVVLAPVRSTPAHAFTPPVDASAKGGSGLNLSDGAVLLVTFLLALGLGVTVLLVRAAGHRRFSLRWRNRWAHSSPPVEDVPDVLQWWLHDDASNGSNGATKDNADAITVTPRPGDAPTGT